MHGCSFRPPFPISKSWGLKAASTHPKSGAWRLPKRGFRSLLGVRIGPGMLKIIKGLMGDDPACVELGFMAEECCHGAILSLTKGTLKNAPLEPSDSRDHFSRIWLKRTYGCTTAAPLLQKGARFWTALKFPNRRHEGRANRMLTYMRNKLVSVEIPADNLFVAYGFLDDHIYSVETVFQVNGTDMTISSG